MQHFAQRIREDTNKSDFFCGSTTKRRGPRLLSKKHILVIFLKYVKIDIKNRDFDLGGGVEPPSAKKNGNL